MSLFLSGTLQNLTGKKASDPVRTRITTGVYFGNNGVDIMATATHVAVGGAGIAQWLEHQAHD